MKQGLRVAVVGAGFFSRFHLEAWSRLPGLALEAIVEPHPQRREAAQQDFGIAAGYPGLPELLQDREIDLLDIVTPAESHLSLVARAAGSCPVIVCQKPLAPSYAEAEAVVRAAEQAGSQLVVHENFRFQPWFREARRLIDQSRLGESLYGITFRLRPGDGRGPRAYLDRQPYFQTMPRLLVHETAIHFIDSFRFLMGEVTAVTARLRRLNPAIAGEDAGLILFEFESGATGLFDGNRLAGHEAENPRLTMGEMLLEGEAASLRLDGRGRLWLRPRDEAEAELAYDWEDRGYAGDCVFALQRHIVESLRHGRSPVNEGRDYLRNMAIEEAIYRSHESGQRIEI